MAGTESRIPDWARPGPQAPIGRLVKHAHVTLRRKLEEDLKEFGLTYAQWSALTAIRRSGVATPSELELILMIERPSVTSLINGLEKRGLVTRREHPDDARSRQIFLTEAGRELADRTEGLTSAAEEKVKAAMTPEQLDALKRLLIRLAEAIGG